MTERRKRDRKPTSSDFLVLSHKIKPSRQTKDETKGIMNSRESQPTLFPLNRPATRRKMVAVENFMQKERRLVSRTHELRRTLDKGGPTDEQTASYNVQHPPPSPCHPFYRLKSPHSYKTPVQARRLESHRDGDNAVDPSPGSKQDDACQQTSERLTERGGEIESTEVKGLLVSPG